MMRHVRMVSVALAALSLGGCTLLVQDTVDDLEPDPFLDLRLELSAFDPHVGQITDVWLVDTSDGNFFVKARAVFHSLTSPNQVVELTDVVEASRTWRVDFYSDLNMSLPAATGDFRPDPPVPSPDDPDVLVFPDHQWRVELENGRAQFPHSIQFTHLTDPADEERARFFLSALHLVVNDTTAHENLPAEIRVYDPSNGFDRQIGLYRLSAIAGDSIDVTIGGILDQGVEYRVELEIDDDGAPLCLTVSGTGTVITKEVSLASISPCPQRG